MTISAERLKEFQHAYQRDFGAEISVEEAREMLSRLVTLYEQLLRLPPDIPEGEARAEDFRSFGATMLVLV